MDRTATLENIAAYRFHDVHPHLRIGTASDRYAGWIGQIYPEERYGRRTTARRRKLGGRTYEERTVPVDSVTDFFEHFDVLEIDYTFYRPLRDRDAKPTNNFFVLQRYASHAPMDATFLLKAPQQYTARRLRRGGAYDENADYLDAQAYVRQFLEPAQEILGQRLQGILFEQEYQRKTEGPSPEQNVDELDTFTRKTPADVQLHFELRSKHLLTPLYFDWLRTTGHGFVFSHWTWLPSLRAQWSLCGQDFSAANGQAVVRLLTPLRVKYEDAYAMAHPFDRTVPAIAETRQARAMIEDTNRLLEEAVQQKVLLNVIANNRAWGSAPELARQVAERAVGPS